MAKNRWKKRWKMVTGLSFIICSLSFSEAQAQSADDSGISAGFFDSSQEKDINFSVFRLPPLAVLFENAKKTPTIQQLAKQQEIAEAEVVKQKKHIFSYVSGHAGYSYGRSDVWSMGSSSTMAMLQQFQGHDQSYWNVGVNLNVPLEDILDMGHSVKRKRLEVDYAQLQKDEAYDQLKLQIVTLYVRITNNLTALKTAGENAAAYQGAEALNELEFHHGNMEIENYAHTGLEGQSAVGTYQGLLTQITTDIVTLEILSHTPIITNTTTEITLDSTIEKTDKQIAKENKAMEKKIKKATEEDIKQEKKEEKEKQKELEQEKKEADRLAREKQKEEDKKNRHKK